jgi:hypothetical protein
MNREEHMLKILRVAAITSLLLGTIASGAGAAGAADNPPNTCTGTFPSPGVLAGTYHGDVVVTGLCLVDGGAAVIRGDLILAPGAALGATYVHNDVAGTGTSSLTVLGDVEVGSDAVLAMGCNPKTTPCTDDPSATGQNRVTGDVRGVNVLAVVVYASTIKGDLKVHGGGGGVTCDPPFPGIFAAVGSPAFSDAEYNTIGGDLKMTGLQTCWAGLVGNSVRGNVSFADNMTVDPTASLVQANHVGGSLACFGNIRAVQYSIDPSINFPNLVRGDASGQCGFNVWLPNPSPDGPLALISVKV